jgi:hypothetical protein
MRDRHLEDFETIWKGILRATEQPDKGWNWDYKLRQGNQEARYESYAIEVDSLTQGLIFLETQWHRSQLPQRYPLVYVEALAVAPWNRRRLEDPPYLRGVGLHALPESEEFYRRNQMPEYDPDPDKEGLVYFEYGLLRR